MGFLTSRQKMGAAALIMGLSIFLSRIMGLVRDKVISWQFGAGGDADIYFAAFVVPDFLNYLLAGGYISITLIPLLSRRFEEDEADAWKFFGTIFFWATAAIVFLTALAWVFAPSLANVVAPGFTDLMRERLVVFLRIVLPAQIFFLPGACLSALLYIRRQFTVPALMPLVYNGSILLFGLALPRLGLAEGMEGFCWGVLAGAFLGAFALPLFAARQGGLKLVPHWRHPLLWGFLVMALPLMLGQSVVVLDEQFVRIFGSLAGEGAVSLLNYARRIMMVPVGVVAQAAGVASFPFLAALAAKGDADGFNSTVNRALRTSLIVIIPMTAWLIAAAGPVLGVIFEGGRFNPVWTAAAAPLLQAMLLAVPFWAIQQVTGRAFYAAKDTLTPALVGTAATVAVVPAYLFLVPILGARAVALVTSLSIFLYASLLMAIARKRWGAELFRGLGLVSGASVALAAPGAILTWALVRFIPEAGLPLSLLARQFLVLGASGLLFVASYMLLAGYFAPGFLHVVLGPILKKFKR